jgi:hypothetical protein
MMKNSSEMAYKEMFIIEYEVFQQIVFAKIESAGERKNDSSIVKKQKVIECQLICDL